jgi:hypothetical protein
MLVRPLVLPILKEEAARNGYTPEQLVARDHHAHVTSVRQYAMWRAKKETGRTWLEVGRFFNRDHTTVIYAYRKIEALPEELRGVFPPRPRVQRRQRDPFFGMKYLGKPCRNGHDGTRYVSTDGCVLCRLERDRRRDRRKKQFFAEAAE